MYVSWSFVTDVKHRSLVHTLIPKFLGACFCIRNHLVTSKNELFHIWVNARIVKRYCSFIFKRYGSAIFLALSWWSLTIYSLIFVKNSIWTRVLQNCPTLSKFIIATNLHIAVKWNFASFHKIYSGIFSEFFKKFSFI